MTDLSKIKVIHCRLVSTLISGTRRKREANFFNNEPSGFHTNHIEFGNAINNNPVITHHGLKPYKRA